MKRWARCVLAVALGLAASSAWANERGEGQYERATALHEERRFDDAAAGFMASYAAGYRTQTSAYNAACALARAGRKDEAFQWLDTAYRDGFDLDAYLDTDRDLQSLRADRRFASLEAKVGRSSRHPRAADEVVERYRALREQDESRADAYEGVARELLRAGRYAEAARAFTSAAVREDNPGKSLYNAACARALHGDTDAALALLRRAVENGFADPAELDHDDDLDGLRADPRFQEIRALAQELDAPAYPAQARDRNARSRREWSAALPRLQATAQRHPDLGEAWFNLGFAHLALGQADQAVAPFERAAALGYRRAVSSYNLACAHALAGHVDAAFAALERALDYGFDNSSLLRSDTEIDGLRGDPRFRRYVK